MPSICLYFQVHQPHRLIPFSVFDIGTNKPLIDEGLNAYVLDRVSDRCYLPANKLLYDLVERFEGKFRFALSLSGMVIEQLGKYRPDVIESFQRLAATGCVEFLGETYYHSLAYHMDAGEFLEQVKMHQDLILETFSQTALTFRNTELIYDDKLPQRVQALGFKAIITEGAERVLGTKTPHQIYQSRNGEMKVLLRDYHRSDDLAFRYTDVDWEYYPLDSSTYIDWIEESNGEVVNIFMDYETLGEHQSGRTGVFGFLEQFVIDAIQTSQKSFLTPSEVVDKFEAVDIFQTHGYLSWADTERDLSAWAGNEMQEEAIEKTIALLKEAKRVGDEKMIEMCRYLQQSDHFYYMATKEGNDGEVHQYFSPYASPHDAYLSFMNIVAHLQHQFRSWDLS